MARASARDDDRVGRILPAAAQCSGTDDEVWRGRPQQERVLSPALERRSLDQLYSCAEKASLPPVPPVGIHLLVSKVSAWVSSRLVIKSSINVLKIFATAGSTRAVVAQQYVKLVVATLFVDARGFQREG